MRAQFFNFQKERLTNNLSTGTVRAGDGAAETLAGNVENSPVNVFVQLASGDLHLVPGAQTIGVAIAPGLADRDIDGDLRKLSGPAAGADEP